LLRVQDLTVHFCLDGAEFPVLDEVTFNIGPGEVVGLLGESGCGKTTTALSILRLLPAAGRVVRGSIRFRERELLALDERQLQKVRGAEISLVFQEPEIMLNPVVRAGDQIAEVIRAHRVWSRRRCREEAEAVLAQVCRPDTSRIYAAYPHQLSGGQRQRVAIAQALACKPALMIADEPTAALDTIIQAEILTLLKDLKERLQIALLLISHDPAVLAKLADRLLVMYAGRIIEEGSPAQIYRNPLHPYTRGLLRSIPQLPGQNPESNKHLPSMDGCAPDLARLPQGCPFEPRCPDRMEICTTRRPKEAQPEASRRVRCFNYGG